MEGYGNKELAKTISTLGEMFGEAIRNKKMEFQEIVGFLQVINQVDTQTRINISAMLLAGMEDDLMANGDGVAAPTGLFTPTGEQIMKPVEPQEHKE